VKEEPLLILCIMSGVKILQCHFFLSAVAVAAGYHFYVQA